MLRSRILLKKKMDMMIKFNVWPYVQFEILRKQTYCEIGIRYDAALDVIVVYQIVGLKKKIDVEREKFATWLRKMEKNILNCVYHLIAKLFITPHEKKKSITSTKYLVRCRWSKLRVFLLNIYCDNYSVVDITIFSSIFIQWFAENVLKYNTHKFEKNVEKNANKSAQSNENDELQWSSSTKSIYLFAFGPE